MYELELFAGAGGGILGKNLLGFRTVGAVEIEPYCRRVLLQRQRDDCCPMFPIWDDVRSFRIDNPECREYIGWLRTVAGELVVSGGFPCQDISSCGTGKGIAGEKSGLWREMARIVGEIRPAFAFVENSPLLTGRGLEEVLSSLAEMGYDAKWCVLGAGHLNYPIKRDRLWILGMRVRSIHIDMRPGSRREPIINTHYGARRTSVVCRMLTSINCWPTVSCVELLMGWPIGWSASAPLETDRFRRWRRSHGKC